MNILFVNYGDFTTNSLNHIGGFANTLCAAGHACIVAVPQRKETLRHVANPLFIAATYEEVLAEPRLFPNGRAADIVHAWTPREGVRKFTVAYQRAALLAAGSARGSEPPTLPSVLIHLEDNERFLLEGYTGKTFAQLRETSAAELEAKLNDSLPHPLRSESFLRIADGITHIVEQLAEFAPPDTPTHLLFPGVDFHLYHPQPADDDFRRELGLDAPQDATSSRQSDEGRAQSAPAVSALADGTSAPHFDEFSTESALTSSDRADDPSATADATTAPRFEEDPRESAPASVGPAEGVSSPVPEDGRSESAPASSAPAEDVSRQFRTPSGGRPRLIVFTGSNTFANEPEMRELYLAVALLNQRGVSTMLVRTGFNSPRFRDGLSDDVQRHVLDLGFIAKARLPKLLALADVLVQPGRAGPFNDYRLPSKLPEFLASGRPVALPTTNLAARLRDGHDAVFLPSGTPDEIADTCERLFADPGLCARLGENGAAFARQHFDLATNTRGLLEFYAATLGRPPAADWSLAEDPTTTDATLFAASLADKFNQAAASLHDPAAEQLATQTDLLAHVVRQLEQSIETSARHRIEAVEADRDAVLARERLTQQHVKNIEDLLAAAKEHAAGLETSRAMTQVYADNMGQELAKHKFRRDQADVLLHTARQQVAAYENALLGADAEIESLKDELADTREALKGANEATAGERAAQDRLRALHAGELGVATDKVAQVEAIVRARDRKIAQMQSSFSWKVTSPFRALRRALLDRPPPPEVSAKLLGNIDYPQDWSAIAPTLNVRGWSLHRDRAPLQAARARLGDQVVSAEFGLERLDVLDHFRDYPGAERCGWIVKADVPRRGTHVLVIEVQDTSGHWHVAVSRPIKRTANAAPPPPNTYAAWVAAYDSLTPDSADKIRAKLGRLTKRPKISVLMPTYNTPEKWLVAAIESVRRQLYENWELCIADDASKAPHVRKILERYQKKDPERIKIVIRETNGHISAASNSALALAHGEFIALLDHDDEIRPHALACVALELDAHPNADLVYSDEDKIDENGHRYDHYFKPDWNPDLFLVQNYVSHLGVYRTLLVREVGGFRVGYEGSQDWDLAMRTAERTAPDRIRHIPKILYHWRSVPGSTAMLIGAKSYATQAAEKVITEHFARVGVAARITPTKGSYWRVHYPVPDPAPRVTLIIPTRNRLNVLRPCLESLLEKTTYPNFEILVVDNDSDDPATLEYLGGLVERDGGAVPESRDGAASPAEEAASLIAEAAEAAEAAPGGTRLGTDDLEGRKVEATGRARVRVVVFPGEFNFSALNNFGVSQTDAPLVGLLNNDLEAIHGDWLDEMVSHALRPEIGCVGAKLYYPDGRIQHAGVILGIGGVAAHAWQTHPRGSAGQAHRNLLQQNLSAVTAACLVIRREVYEEVGGLEDDKLKIAFNDVDFCLKVRAAGYRNLWTPYAELYHHESASRGAEDTLEKRDRFRTEVEYVTERWGDALVNDPAYNPNLTLTINDFTLSAPPRRWPPLED